MFVLVGAVHSRGFSAGLADQPCRGVAAGGCYYSGDGGDQPEERPTVLPFVTCADGAFRLDSMRWSSWGDAGAQGTGVFSFKVCQPNCAEGHRAQYAVDVAPFDRAPPSPNSGCPQDMLFYNEMSIMSIASPPTPADEMPVNTTRLRWRYRVVPARAPRGAGAARRRSPMSRASGRAR